MIFCICIFQYSLWIYLHVQFWSCFWVQMLPTVAYADNPSTSYAAKFVHASTNKNRCSINRVLVSQIKFIFVFLWVLFSAAWKSWIRLSNQFQFWYTIPCLIVEACNAKYKCCEKISVFACRNSAHVRAHICLFIRHHHLDFVSYDIGCKCSLLLLLLLFIYLEHSTFTFFPGYRLFVDIDLMHSALCTVLLFHSTGFFFLLADELWGKKNQTQYVHVLNSDFFGTLNTCLLWQM